MRTKTAMQEFIEYLEGIQERNKIPTWVITTAKNHLQSEKQQLLDSWEDGAYGGGQFTTTHDSAEEYYNETYGN